MNFFVNAYKKAQEIDAAIVKGVKAAYDKYAKEVAPAVAMRDQALH
jgi:hypothetical protein